jgi:hypothetical protein
MTAAAATAAPMNFRRLAIPLPCFGFPDNPIKVAGLSIKHRPSGPMQAIHRPQGEGLSTIWPATTMRGRPNRVT